MDIKEIESEIRKLEQGSTDYATCSKLAVLYCINDHFRRTEPQIESGYSYSQSEFLSAVYGADINHVLQIMDEHMDCIQLLYPKEYKTIIGKIKKK